MSTVTSDKTPADAAEANRGDDGHRGPMARLGSAGWQDSSSQSVAARNLIGRNFGGLGSTGLQVVVVDHHEPLSWTPQGRQTLDRVAAVLRSDPRVSTVVPPQPGVTLSADGRTAVVMAGAAAGPNTMVRAADALEAPVSKLSRPGISVNLTGDGALWSQFNKANRSAMLRSELLSWPVTLVILVVAFGSLIAAGLPLMLTMAGLLVAAGALVLVLANHVAPVSIWALNFALMFALALGIDYALVLLSAAKERYETHADPERSMLGAVRTSGRVVVSAAAIMVAVFLTVALSGPLAPKEMGVILAVAVAVDAVIVRLVLLPVLLRLGGRHIWSRPAWLGRLLPDIRFSH